MQNEKGSSELQLRRTPKKWFITLSLYEGRKEKSMIKAEKTGNKMELEIKGDTHDLIFEFDAVLKAMCEVLDRNLVKAAPFTAEDLLNTMVHNIVAEGK